MIDVAATSVDNCVLAEVEGRAEQDPEETRAVIFPPSSQQMDSGQASQLTSNSSWRQQSGDDSQLLTEGMV